MGAVGISERVPADALGHPHHRMGEDQPVFGGTRDLDESAHRGRDARKHAVDDVGELGVVARGRTEEQPERGSIALDEAEVRGEPFFDARPPRLDTARRLAQDIEEPSADVLEYGDEQRALRRKVLVEDGLRDAGGEGEVSKRTVRGRLGSGGKLLRVRTGDGSIRLRQY